MGDVIHRYSSILPEDVLVPTKHSICKSGQMCKIGHESFMFSSITCMDEYMGKHVGNYIFIPCGISQCAVYADV